MNTTENQNEMTYTVFVEDDVKYPHKLSLFRNTNNKLFMEIGPEETEDSMITQWIVLDLEDAMVLRNVLDGIISDIRECAVVEQVKAQPAWLAKEKQQLQLSLAK